MPRSRRKRAHITPSIVPNSDPPAYSESSSVSEESESSQTDSDTPKPVATKRKKTHIPTAPAPTAAPANAPKIMYILTLLSHAEAKKSTANRCAKSLSLSLSQDEPWDTVMAQLMVKISQAFSVDVVDLGNYKMMFSIPRYCPKPGALLQSEDDYGLLLHHYRKASPGKEQAVNVSITENVPVSDKENVPADDAKKKGKKTKDPDSYPGNQQRIQNMQILQGRWKCPKKQENCLGKYCYVDPDGIHLPLNLDRLETWASAMMQGETIASVESPPNHKLFDMSLALSPVLKHRLKANAAAIPAMPAAPAAPVFNFSIGGEVAKLFAPAMAAAPAADTNADAASLKLLPSTRSLGQDIPIEEFCQQHQLDNEVLQKLQANRFKNARILRFVTIADLKEMGFLPGEIGELRDAVEKWSEKVAA